MTAESGSGKTLAYLLPIMNQLFHFKDKTNVAERGLRFRMNKSNEEQMFLSAGELAYQQSQSGSKRLNLSKAKNEMKGAIILSYSKELLN